MVVEGRSEVWVSRLSQIGVWKTSLAPLTVATNLMFDVLDTNLVFTVANSHYD